MDGEDRTAETVGLEWRRLSSGFGCTFADRGKQAEGVPLLFLAPLGRDHTAWAEVLPFFEEEHRCVLPNYRGTGGSDRASSSHSLRQFAADAAELVDDLAISRIQVIGYSMGAATAMELAIQRPDLVSRLVLVSPWSYTDRNLGECFEIMRLLAKHCTAEQYERAVAWLIFSPDYLEMHWDEVLKGIGDLITTSTYPTVDTMVGHVEASIAHDVRDRLAAISAPTTVIAGECDRLTPPSYAEDVCEGIPNASYELITGSGSSHGLVRERLDTLVSIAGRFLRVGEDGQPEYLA